MNSVAWTQWKPLTYPPNRQHPRSLERGPGHSLAFLKYGHELFSGLLWQRVLKFLHRVRNVILISPQQCLLVGDPELETGCGTNLSPKQVQPLCVLVFKCIACLACLSHSFMAAATRDPRSECNNRYL